MKCQALFALLIAYSSQAAVYEANPSNYLQIVQRLRAGDHMKLAAGDYINGLPLHGINGRAGQPIIIYGPNRGTKRAVFHGRSGANTISIVNSSVITVRNLVVDGRGLAVDGVTAEGHSRWAHHITLERLHIINHHYDQGTAGISTRCLAWGWIIRDNIIERSGTGMYLGHSNGHAPFFAGLIENNVVIDSVGYNLQIKHQIERPTIDGMPEASLTIIRRNVFSKSANSSTGKMARPNVLVGHWPLSGPGAEDAYAIYGNFFFENPSEALFQGEGNIAFYSNVLINSHGDAINIQPHNAQPRRIDIFRNTVIATNAGIRVSGGDASYTQRVTGNAVFAKVPIIGGKQEANITDAVAEAVRYLNRPFGKLDRLNLAPRAGKLATEPFSSSAPENFPDAQLDFDGRRYLRRMAGAYAGEKAVRPLRISPQQ
jgi:hypothetical protein